MGCRAGLPARNDCEEVLFQVRWFYVDNLQKLAYLLSCPPLRPPKLARATTGSFSVGGTTDRSQSKAFQSVASKR